jgi:hypothetical protein
VQGILSIKNPKKTHKFKIFRALIIYRNKSNSRCVVFNELKLTVSFTLDTMKGNLYDNQMGR